jgi:hypothetical protein
MAETRRELSYPDNVSNRNGFSVLQTIRYPPGVWVGLNGTERASDEPFESHVPFLTLTVPLNQGRARCSANALRIVPGCY